MKAPPATRIPEQYRRVSFAGAMSEDDLLHLAIRHVKERGVDSADFLVEVAAVLEDLMDAGSEWPEADEANAEMATPAIGDFLAPE